MVPALGAFRYWRQIGAQVSAGGFLEGFFAVLDVASVSCVLIVSFCSLPVGCGEEDSCCSLTLAHGEGAYLNGLLAKLLADCEGSGGCDDFGLLDYSC
jgi:hypothetical protein